MCIASEYYVGVECVFVCFGCIERQNCVVAIIYQVTYNASSKVWATVPRLFVKYLARAFHIDTVRVSCVYNFFESVCLLA